MSYQLLTKLWTKFFNNKDYAELKYNISLKKKLKNYRETIKPKIIKIHHKIKSQKSLNFLHSGHIGDLIYSLSLIKTLSKTHQCNFFVEANKKMNFEYKNHPSGDVMINDRMINLLLPLLRKQNFLNTVNIYNKEEIDINLNLFRDVPINLLFHTIRWYSHLTGVPVDIAEKFLDVKKFNNFNNKIVIVRSTRNRNYFINYNFLRNVKNIVCVGLKEEYENLKKDIPHLEFYDCKDFLEMAEIINSCKFFIGNQTFAYSIAEGLKIPRLLEVFPDFPVVFPVGENCYDFYHQVHFEKYFNLLNNIE
jgi:hypothetical protein|tara:strand:- start:195 stop:1112 length:918 start_codon:yes stop_codon:yes gene_type:complete